MAIITEFYVKIKLFGERYFEEIGVSLIIILVGISSFLLGKYSVLREDVSNNKIIIQNKAFATSTSDRQTSPTTLTSIEEDLKQNSVTNVVASKNGKRYYYSWCASANRILPKNRVFFASALEAERVGLTLAANCK